MKKLTRSSFFLFFSSSLFLLTVLCIVVFQSCKKEDEPNKSPSCNITSPLEGEECKQNEIVTINVTASDSDGNIAEVQFFIDDISKSTVNSSPYKYDWNTAGESLGNHTLKATSIDNEGASTSDEVTIDVIKQESSDFTASPISGIAPLTVNFTDHSTNNPISWLWDFGDGGSSTEQSPSHTYNNMGQYDVTLISTNQSGSETETKTDFIIVKGNMTDVRDNQTYSIVSIGDQTWFAENLNYETADSWRYDNEEANGELYGRLYTWDAAINACPNGWHLPSDDEWKTLEMYMGMSQSEADGEELRGTDEAKKLKSTSGWLADENGTDDVGFAALPGGRYNPNGGFQYLGSWTDFWTLNEHAELVAWYRYFEQGTEQIGRNYYRKNYGFSIRCVKN